MKRFLLIAACLVSASLLSLSAASPKEAEAFVKSIASEPFSFSYDYEIFTEVLVVGSGKACVFGKSYRVESGDMLFCSDGKTRWTVDSDSKEIYIESVDEASKDYLSNPAALLSSLSEAFTIAEEGSLTLSGKHYNGFKLVPSVKGTGLSSVTLYFSGKTPARVEVVPVDGPKAVFTLASFAEDKKDGTRFTVDPASYGKSFLVTDLR